LTAQERPLRKIVHKFANQIQTHNVPAQHAPSTNLKLKPKRETGTAAWMANFTNGTNWSN